MYAALMLVQALSRSLHFQSIFRQWLDSNSIRSSTLRTQVWWRWVLVVMLRRYKWIGDDAGDGLEVLQRYRPYPLKQWTRGRETYDTWAQIAVVFVLVQCEVMYSGALLVRA